MYTHLRTYASYTNKNTHDTIHNIMMIIIITTILRPAESGGPRPLLSRPGPGARRPAPPQQAIDYARVL